MNNSSDDFLSKAISDYVDCARESFRERIDNWDVDIFEKEVNEVVGGVLARQLSLATTIAQSPPVWSPHVLPVVLRCMADVYITFCWIVKDVKPRSRQFIEYGLGQEKLAIEKYRETLSEEDNPDPDAVKFLELRERMLDAERYRFLIPVNIGSWSEMSIRDMAIEVGEKEFYDLVFTQFSASLHSTWQHIWRMNLVPCSNPLHMGHRMPCDPDIPPDPGTFMNSAKYLCKTFAKFDVAILGAPKHGDAYKCYDLIEARFVEYFNQRRQDKEEGEERRTAPKKGTKTKAFRKKSRTKKRLLLASRLR